MEKPRSLYEQYAQDIALMGVEEAKRVHGIDQLVEQKRRNSWRVSNLPIKSWRNAITGNVIIDINSRVKPAIYANEKLISILNPDSYSDEELDCPLRLTYVDQSKEVIQSVLDTFSKVTYDTQSSYESNQLPQEVVPLYKEFMEQFNLLSADGFSRLQPGISGMKYDSINLADEVAAHLFNNVTNPVFLQWIQGMEASFRTFILPQSGRHLEEFDYLNRQILRDPNANSATGFVSDRVEISKCPFSQFGVSIKPVVKEDLRQNRKRATLRSEKTKCPARLRYDLVTDEETPDYAHVMDETYHLMTGFFRRIKL